MNNNLEALRNHLKEDGWAKTLLKGSRFLRDRVFKIEKGIVYRFDLASLSERKSRFSRTYQFKWGGMKDLVEIEREGVLRWDMKRWKYSLKRLKEGDRFLLVLFETKVIGYLWVMIGALELTETRRIPIPETSACFYNGLLRREFRGRWVVQNTISYALNYLSKEGIERVYLITFLASFGRLMERMGFEPVGFYREITFLTRKFPLLSRQVRQWLTHD